MSSQQQTIYVKLVHLLVLTAIIPAQIGDNVAFAQTSAPTCPGVLTETYNPDADVIIGFIGSRRLSSSNSSLCDINGGWWKKQLYEVAKIIVDNPPSSVLLPNVSIGLELYDDCGSSSLVTKAALHYASSSQNQCDRNQLRPGVIGPTVAAMFPAAAAILSAADVPIVSPTASVASNNDKDRGNILRTLPSTSHQAQVLVDLAEYFGWTYMTLVATRGEYGERGADETRRLATEKGICTSDTILFDDPETNSFAYEDVITTLLSNTEAKGVVMWCSSNNIAGLLDAIHQEQGDAYDLILLTSDSALSNLTLLELYTNAARGLIGIRSFDSSNNEATLNYLNQNKGAMGEFDNPASFPVANAMLSYEHRLSDIHQDKCGGAPGICPAMAALSTQEMMGSFKKSSFPLISGEDFTFDSNGEPSDFTLEILQYQNDTSRTDSANIRPQQVGVWKPNSGLLLMGTFQHYTQTGLVNTTPSSTCGTLCSSCSSSNPSLVTPSSNLVTTDQDRGGHNGGGADEVYRNRGDLYMRIPGALDIPVILSISEPGYFDHYDGILCGHLDEKEVLTAEALLYALDKVNADPKILPGLKLGVTVMDSCRHSVIATRQLAGVLGQTTTLEASGPTLGVIGPDTDDVANKVVSEITAPSRIITIGHGNTPSANGSPNFFQTSPSLDEQVRAIASLLTELDWFYTGIIYSASTYGKTGYQAFIAIAKEYGICLGPAREIPQNPMQPDFDSILFDMYDTLDLNVIVTFVDEKHVRRLLVTQHLYGFERFSWVGTETWTVDADLFEGFESQAEGSLAVIPAIGDMTELQQYLSEVPLQNATARNPWLRPALTEIFPCVVNENATRPTGGSPRQQRCRLNLPRGVLGELIPMGQYNNDIFHVINAFYALAHGTDQLRQTMCTNQSDPLCLEFFQAIAVQGPNFFEAVGNISFSAGGEQFSFTNKSGPPSFTVQNFQYSNGSGIEFINIGTWSENTNLTIDSSILNLANTIVLGPQRDPRTCGFCFGGPNMQEPIEVLEWELEGLWVTIVLAASATCLGLIICTFATFIFNYNHPVVTSGDLSISIWLLIGLSMMYLMNLVYMLHASTTICAIRRVGTALAYAVTYSALSVRSIRINRLARGKPGDSMSFMGSMSQTFLFCVFLSAQFFIAAAWLLLQPPNANAIPGAIIRCEGNENLWSCDYTHLELVISLSYVYALALFVFFSSIGSVKYAHFAHEGRFLHVTALVNMAVLIAWACVYILADQNIAIPALCIGSTTDATIILAAMFLPKCGAIGKPAMKDPTKLNHKPDKERTGVVNQNNETTNF